jgi:hypothetical protein
LVQKAQKAVMTICEGVDEMRCINANTALWWTLRGCEGWVSWSSIIERWDCLSWECWGCWSIHECPRPVHECPRPVHELKCYWSSYLQGYYKPVLQLEELEWYSRPIHECSTPIHECARPFYELGRLLNIVTCYYML